MATSANDPQPPAPTPVVVAGRGLLTRPWVRILGLYLAALCVCAPIVTLQVRAHNGLFVLDEIMYVDYLYRVDGGTIALPHGQKLGAATIEQRECRGIEIIGATRDPIPHSCSGRPVDMALLPNGGYNSADIYPPTYFVITDAAARVIMATGATHDLVTAGRLTGALWMAAALVVVYLLAVELGASRRSATLAMALAGSASWLLVFWYHLTPDAASVFLGGLMFLLALRWERRSVHWGWLLAVAGLLVLVKPANVLATTMACLFLLIRGVRAWRCLDDGPVPTAGELSPLLPSQLEQPPVHDAVRRSVQGIAALLAGSLGALAAWFAVRIALYPAGSMTPYDNRFRAHGFSVHWIVDNVATFLTIPNMGQHNVGNPEIFTLVLVFGSVAALAMLLPGRARLHSAAVSVLALTVSGAWLIVFLLLITQDVYSLAEPRYGLSLVAAAIATAATLWRTRSAQVIVALLALALLVNAAGLTGRLKG
jgi:Dolichyl-phosphate-mannose-protein mannosyltransferase